MSPQNAKYTRKMVKKWQQAHKNRLLDTLPTPDDPQTLSECSTGLPERSWPKNSKMYFLRFQDPLAPNRRFEI